MRKWMFLLLCAAILMGTATARNAPTHTAYLHGYPDGTLRPDAALTREELAQMLLRLTGFEPRDDAFFDVPPTRWSYRAICAVTQMGIMEAEKGYFHPTETVCADEFAAVLTYFGQSEAHLPEEEAITRAQGVHLLNQILRRQPQTADDLMDGMVMFFDNMDTSAWYFADLQEASCAHTYKRTAYGECWTGLG